MATLNGGRGWASDACAASVHRLDSAFGRILPINSAGRAYAEQAEAYRKYKNGGPLALPPGTSIHESGNAIDWHNSVWGILGLNAGTGWRGQPINRHGHRRTVASETWHTEYAINEDNFRGQGGSNQVTRDRQNWLNVSRGEKLDEDGIEGPATKEAYKRYQIFLRDNGFGYTGAIDGDWGPGTQSAHQRYFDSRQANNWPANKLYGEAHVKNLQDLLNRAGYGPLAVDGQDGPATQAAVKRAQKDFGLAEDGVGGPITVNALTNKLTPAPIGRNITSRSTYDVQRKLIEKGYDLGPYGADGDYAAATTTAVAEYQGDNGLEPDGIYGPLTDEKLFTAAPVTPAPSDGNWPTNGRNATTRPTRDIQKLVGVEADDQYGPKTSVGVAKWQKANGLDADGIWGPASDAKGFSGVPLPDAPVTPGRDETYGKKIPTYPGATWADISPNKSVREDTIQFFVIHHAADPRDKQTQIDRFMTANDRNVSPNWFIGADGSASEIVPPDDYRAWTTGKFDHKAITVETQNTSGDPSWGISRESHERIADIAAWAADRYGLALDRKTIIGHREVPGAATACPGPSMDLEWIVARAKEIFAAKYAEKPEEPVVTEPIPIGNEKIKAEIMDLLEQVARKVDSL